ncbi:hypothetical protein [Nocardioides sp. zg-DK7169]|uniref:hypothetical protein n=1 Tax=Nocardioides sp. zg-DK7169 TaxID=2736600 RepID=UPI0015552C1A|nr:hypothetical protein [Nocardioides sp. zg-DK7169]NPC95473.1 hypothetical protein [Nocardioides sp. zg-DK7169]
MSALRPTAGPTARLAYDDLATLPEMQDDCRAAGAHLPAAAAGGDLARAARAAVRPAPSILFADYPTDSAKGLEVTEAAQRLANALHLHLD